MIPGHGESNSVGRENATPPTSDIDRYRARIEHLYLKENVPLNDIIVRLQREVGLYASRNMYLKKLSAWGLKKNNMRKKAAQLAQSRTTKSDAIQKRGPNKPKALDSKKKQLAISSKVIISPKITVLQPSLDISERYLSWIRQLQTQYAGLDKKLGPVGPDTGTLVRVNFYGSIIGGVSMMQHAKTGNDTKVAGALMEKGFRSAELALQSRDPMVIILISLVLLVIFHKEMQDVAEVLTKYLYQLSRKIFGVDHPLTNFCDALYQQKDFDLILNGIKVAYQATADVKGKYDATSLTVKKALVNSLLLTGASYEEMCSGMESLMIECDNTLGASRLGTAIRKDFATYLATQANGTRAIQLLREAASPIFQEGPPDPSLIDLAIQCCHEWGKVLMNQPKYDNFEEDEVAHRKRYIEVERILKLAIEKSIQYLGPSANETIMASKQLASFYNEYGRLDEAQARYEWIQEQLAEFTLHEEEPESKQ